MCFMSTWDSQAPDHGDYHHYDLHCAEHVGTPAITSRRGQILASQEHLYSYFSCYVFCRGVSNCIRPWRQVGTYVSPDTLVLFEVKDVVQVVALSSQQNQHLACLKNCSNKTAVLEQNTTAGVSRYTPCLLFRPKHLKWLGRQDKNKCNFTLTFFFFSWQPDHLSNLDLHKLVLVCRSAWVFSQFPSSLTLGCYFSPGCIDWSLVYCNSVSLSSVQLLA